MNCTNRVGRCFKGGYLRPKKNLGRKQDISKNVLAQFAAQYA